jgi:hypothetical protein
MEISRTEGRRTEQQMRRLAQAVLPIGLAVWAQWTLFFERLVLDGIILFALAIAAFVGFGVAGQRLQPLAATEAGSPSSPPLRWPAIMMPLALTIVFSGLAWILATGNRFRFETVLFWFLAVGFYLFTFWERSPATTERWDFRLPQLSARSISLSWSLVGLVLVMVVAVFFRLHQIASVPAEMVSDHAEKLLDVQDVINGEHRIFFPRNTGREPLQFYLAVPFVWLVGLNHLALKLTAATVSLATVPVVYLIGREISGARYGLIAAALLAVSKWDVAIGRVGLRFPFYPFFTALAFFFLLRALKHGRRNDYLLCGLTTGIGLYGYSPFRAMLLIIAGVLAVKLVFEIREGLAALLRAASGGALILGAIAVVFIPLARYMVEDPGMFWFRALTRVAAGERSAEVNPVMVLAGNVINGLAMFNWRGDVVWVNTVPHDPLLDYVTGGLFALGLAWCLRSLVKHREPVAAYLLMALLIAMLPSILSIAFPGENPSAVRAGAAGVFAVLIAAMPLHLMARWIQSESPGGRRALLAGAIVVIVLVMVGQAGYERYFGAYDQQYRQSAINATEISRVIVGFSSSIGSSENVYIKSYPHWVDTRNVAFSIGQPAWNNVLMTGDDLLRHNPPQGNRLYVMHRDDAEGARLLQQRFPEGQLQRKASQVRGREFLVFFVPGSP